MSFEYPKQEKLKSKKLIEQLFSEGKSITVFPLRLVYLECDFNDETKVKASVSVSKRHFKKAVDRNAIKRLMRESYRLNKPHYFNNILSSYALMILYIGKDSADYDTINDKMKTLLSTFSKRATQ